MIKTITFTEFDNEFYDLDRSDNFSYKGRKALYNYLVDLEYSCNISIELDVISFCCDYSEYSIDQLKAQYGMDIDEIYDNNTVIMVEDFGDKNPYTTVIIADF